MRRFAKKIIAKIIEWEARIVLAKYKPKIIAVTGNVGKTTTKDAIYALLAHKYFVRKSEKSFNSSDIGVPLSILGLDNAWNNPILWIRNIVEGLALIFLKNHYPKWLVLEVGADRPGEIKHVAEWLRPDIVVVTHIGEVPVHVEFFRSAKELAREKGYLVQSLKRHGTLVLNCDDENTYALKELSRERVITYGHRGIATVAASNDGIFTDKNEKIAGVHFKVNYDGKVLPVRLSGTAGLTHVFAALAALGVALTDGENLVRAVEWVQRFEIPPGRMKLIEGARGAIIIDDTYNASPAATKAALSAMAHIPAHGRKIAVLGDMLEIGKHAAEEHKKTGELVAESCNLFIAVGMRMRGAAEEALSRRMGKRNVLVCDDSTQAGRELAKIARAGDVVLVKGSQVMRMERVVHALMAHPEDAPKLLVRQDREWLSRP